jgi:hypothetical protein
MQKHVVAYMVEDDLDLNFFEALKHMKHPTPEASSAQIQQTHEDEDEDALCLITNEKLNLFHISLQCGHKFNYEPLYQEVLRQKGRTGIINNYHEKIDVNQIKCPYCRTLTNRLLPCIGQHPVIKRLAGVNSPAHMCMPGVKCSVESCNANSFYEHNVKPYCLRHYKTVLKTKTKTKTDSSKLQIRCSAEVQTGENKGKRCKLNACDSNLEPPLCKKHSKCNVILYQQ